MNEEYWLPYCLEAANGHFGRFIIYDIGSQDSTRDVIDWFIKRTDAEVWYRPLPFVPPRVQGTFRNSMNAETQADWYFILDGDEIYSPEGYDALIQEMENMKEMYISKGRTYGVARRVEVDTDLLNAYGQDLKVSHHRVYHRKMVFTGPHPGEAPLITQTKKTDHWFSKEVVCYHMHNCQRSRLDQDVPKRIQRRMRGTYHPGDKAPIDILDKIPLLRTQIDSAFLVNPALEYLWQKDHD